MRVPKNKGTRAEKSLMMRVPKNKVARADKRIRPTRPKIPSQNEDTIENNINVIKVKHDDMSKKEKGEGTTGIISGFRNQGINKDNAVSTASSMEKAETP
eukprot:5586100-Ditylum_brightwellii.AAC.1